MILYTHTTALCSSFHAVIKQLVCGVQWHFQQYNLMTLYYHSITVNTNSYVGLG